MLPTWLGKIPVVVGLLAIVLSVYGFLMHASRKKGRGLNLEYRFRLGRKLPYGVKMTNVTRSLGEKIAGK